MVTRRKDSLRYFFPSPLPFFPCPTAAMLSAARVKPYGHKTLLGNWFEDQRLEEERTAQFVARRAAGTLKVHQAQGHLDEGLRDATLSRSADGRVRVGDSVLLFAEAAGGVLCGDTRDRLELAHPCFGVSASAAQRGPVARNVFTVEAAAADEGGKTALRYGDSFRLRSSLKAGGGAALRLGSQPRTSVSQSRVSGQQEVYLTPSRGADTLWRVQHASHDQRFESVGLPVPANAAVVLEHAATGTPLSADPAHKFENDFGLEVEVSAGGAAKAGRVRALSAEASGAVSQGRATLPSQRWALLTAADE